MGADASPTIRRALARIRGAMAALDGGIAADCAETDLGCVRAWVEGFALNVSRNPRISANGGVFHGKRMSRDNATYLRVELLAMEKMRAAGVAWKDIAAALDRPQGAVRSRASRGFLPGQHRRVAACPAWKRELHRQQAVRGCPRVL